MKKFLKFTLFSLSAGFIQFLLFTLLNETWKPNYWISYLIALIISVLYNFTLNRKFTFRSTNNIPKALTLLLIFYVIFVTYSTWLEHYLTDIIGWNEYLVTLINMAQNLILEFLWCRFIIYRKNKNERNRNNN